MITASLPDVKQFLGLELGDAQLHVSRTILGDEVRRTTSASRIPPSILLPIDGAEPYRLDARWPAHPRGSGRNWPEEARFDIATGAGRLPAALAWSLLQRKKSWVWSQDRARLVVSPATAIGVAAADYCGASADNSAVLVIPNFCDSASQQEILEAAEARGCRLRLLWRPVAAALAWLRQLQAGASDRRTQLAEDDTVVFVYFGYEQIETTVLRLRLEEGMLVPARERPQPNHLVASPGLAGLINTAAALMRDEPSSAGLWNTLWTTGLLREIGLTSPTEQARTRNDAALHRQVEFDRDLLERVWLKGIAGGICAAGREFFAAHQAVLGEALQFDHLTTWIASARSASFAAKPKYAVAFGPMAGALLDAQRNFATAVFEALPSVSRVWLEGTDTKLGLAAEGAALYAERISLQQPTYLDRLPRLGLQVMRDGEACWLDLLDEHNWVSGGRPWSRDDYDFKLAIQRDSASVQLALDHGEFDYVRLLEARFPKHTTEPETLTLRTEIEPAQGNARIYLRPQNPAALGKSRILVDWATMVEAKNERTGQGLTAAEFLKTLPKAFPDCNPRRSSPTQWPNCAQLIAQYLRTEATTSLDQAVRAIQQIDHSEERHGIEMRSVSSDGEVASNGDELTRFTDRMEEKIPRRYENTNSFRLYLRALTYTSSDRSKLSKLLVETLRTEGARTPKEILIASGHCFRQPEHVAYFVRSLCNRLDVQPEGTYWWFKSLADMLRYRDSALMNVETPICERLVDKAFAVFLTERRNGRPSHKSMCMAMVITYLLRRRKYDDAFLDPTAGTAIKIKSAFGDAIRTIASQPGTNAIRERFRLLLSIMIDYIDRRGSGLVFVGDE